MLRTIQDDLDAAVHPRRRPRLDSAAWWHWCGGLLGMFFIAMAAFAGPRIGATLFMALVIAGQLAMSLSLDHFGWAGFRQDPVTLGKLAGVVLIGAGVWCIARA